MPKKTTTKNTKANEPHSTEDEVIEPIETETETTENVENVDEDKGNTSTYGVWNKKKVARGSDGIYTLKDDKYTKTHFKREKEDVIELNISDIFDSGSDKSTSSTSKEKSTNTKSDSDWFIDAVDKSADYIDSSLSERPSLIKNSWNISKNVLKLGLSAIGVIGVGLAVTNKAFGDTELGKTVEGEITLFNALSSKSSSKAVKATGRDLKSLYDYTKGKFDD